jgi:hypothetical protein
VFQHRGFDLAKKKYNSRPVFNTLAEMGRHKLAERV